MKKSRRSATATALLKETTHTLQQNASTLKTLPQTRPPPNSRTDINETSSLRRHWQLWETEKRGSLRRGFLLTYGLSRRSFGGLPIAKTGVINVDSQYCRLSSVWPEWSVILLSRHWSALRITPGRLEKEGLIRERVFQATVRSKSSPMD